MTGRGGGVARKKPQNARRATVARRKPRQGDVLPAETVMASRRFRDEAEFQRWVCDLLDLYHWRWHHEVDSRKSKRGLPDLIAVRGSRLLFIELKAPRGRLTEDQIGWLTDVVQLRCRQVEAHIWKPANVELIEKVLA